MTDPRDELPDLDPAAAALLGAYRRGRVMPPAARARVRDTLDRTCPEAHVLSLRRERSAAWALALALAAAAVLWFARRPASVAERSAAPASMSPAQAAPAATGDAATRAKALEAPAAPDPAPLDPATATPAGASLAAPAAPHSAPIEAPHAATSPPPPVRGHHDVSRPTSNARPRDLSTAHEHPPRPADPPTDSSEHETLDLREEQRLLARGWQALAAGQADAAARDADEHARRFPGGVLEPERRALAAAAACAVERERGRTLARAFLADHPRSPLARRLREACELAP